MPVTVAFFFSALFLESLNFYLTSVVSFVDLQVITYVLDEKKFREHLQRSDEGDTREGNASKKGEGFTVTSRESLDLVEVLCGDRVLEPHLYIGERSGA